MPKNPEIEKILDEMEDDRNEWDRLENDLFPEGKRKTGPKIKKVHKGSSLGNKWQNAERHR
jgi:hypothetical protein